MVLNIAGDTLPRDATEDLTSAAVDMFAPRDAIQGDLVTEVAVDIHQDAATGTEELTGDHILPGDATLGDTPQFAVILESMSLLVDTDICHIAEAATCFIFKVF